MQTRELGRTKIRVSELSLGTWGLAGDAYGEVPPGEAKRVIERALLMGITLFETADCYGQGELERLLGSVLKKKKVTVVTKWGTDLAGAPAQKRFDPEFIEKSARASRHRLGAEIQLIGLLHNPSCEALEKGDATAALKKLKEEGIIQSWGVSVGDHDVANAAIDADTPLLSFAHNLLQVQPLRSVEKKIKEKGIGVLAHSLLFYGLLAGRWAPNKTFRMADHRSERWPGGIASRIRHLDAVRPLVSGDVTTMRSAAVRFVLSNPLISSAILGPRTSSQLDQLVRECRSVAPYLSEGKLSALEARLEELKVPR